MVLSTSMLANDLGTIIADLPTTLVWTPSGGSQQTITDGVTIGEIDHSRTLDVPGYMANSDTECVVPIASFTDSTTPSIGDTLTVSGDAYRVDNYLEGQDGVAVRLFLTKDRGS